MSGFVLYRRLHDSEIEAVSELARRVFDEFIGPSLSAEGREEFHRNSSPQAFRDRAFRDVTFVAERDGQIVGMLQLSQGEHISMLFVDGKNQRQGIGRNLVGAAVKYALARQPPACVLTVGSSPNAVPAYERMGFVAVGGEQVEQGIRFVQMQLEINSATINNLALPPFEPPNIFYLQAAQGWLELGNHAEANLELNNVSPSSRNHPAVLELRWQIYAVEKKWEAALEIASMMIHLAPGYSVGWIDRSFALHELNRTIEARDNLLPVVQKFPDEPILRYNLACYECRLGRLEQAKDWLEKAFRTGDARKIKSMALKDPDLEPLWRQIGQI